MKEFITILDRDNDMLREYQETQRVIQQGFITRLGLPKDFANYEIQVEDFLWAMKGKSVRVSNTYSRLFSEDSAGRYDGQNVTRDGQIFSDDVFTVMLVLWDDTTKPKMVVFNKSDRQEWT